MPELPDVEGFSRYFSRHAAGRRVRAVEVRDSYVVRNTSAQGLGRALEGRTLGKPVRRGKWLLVPVGDSTLVFHFGMTGGFSWTSRPDAYHRHDRVVLHLRGGELRYRDMRKLGGIWIARSARGLERITGPLGPDALDVDLPLLRELFQRRRGGLKAALMDQRLLSGIGNELSDEILWQARLHPSRHVSDLKSAQLRRLHAAMRKVLEQSARRGRIPRERGWLTSVRGQRAPRCPRCHAPIRKLRSAGRTAYVCLRCQRR